MARTAPASAARWSGVPRALAGPAERIGHRGPCRQGEPRHSGAAGRSPPRLPDTRRTLRAQGGCLPHKQWLPRQGGGL
eukprot:scaffold21967_cov114-Isochrysis_galbana.AAC.1